MSEVNSIDLAPTPRRKRLNRKEAVKRRVHKAEQEASRKLPDVIEVYTNLLASPNEAIRIKAADALRDIAMGKPGQRKPREDEDEKMLLVGEFPDIPA